MLRGVRSFQPVLSRTMSSQATLNGSALTHPMEAFAALKQGTTEIQSQVRFVDRGSG